MKAGCRCRMGRGAPGWTYLLQNPTCGLLTPHSGGISFCERYPCTCRWARRGALRTRHTLEPLAWHWSHWPGRLVNQGGGVSVLAPGWQRWGREGLPPAAPALSTCPNVIDYFTEMCSGSKAGSYLRLVDFVYHSTLGLRVTKKKMKRSSIRKSSTFTESLCTEAGSYLRLVDFCITHLKAQGPSEDLYREQCSRRRF